VSNILRIALILFSILSTIYTLLKIRKSQILIGDAIYWIVFSFGLVVLSIFPNVAVFGAKLLGITSPVNFVFLVVLFFLIIKLFTLSIEMSIYKSKLRMFIEEYSVRELDKEAQKQQIPSSREILDDDSHSS
jgi:hypothetical protein